MCRAPIKSQDLPEAPFQNPIADARRREHIQRVISEPAYAAIPVIDRPIRLARVMISFERAERERSLNQLIEQRQVMLARQASLQQTPSEPAPLQPPQMPAVQPQSQEPQASTSGGLEISRLGSPLPEKGQKRVHDSDTSSASSQASGPQLVISESQASSTVASQMPPPSQIPSLNSPRPRSAACSQDSQIPRKLQPSPELQAINIRIAVAQSQLDQLAEEAEPQDMIDLAAENDELEPEWIPSQGEDDLQPVAIIGTWGRGRHIRYRIRWSDGSISLNRTKEVEVRARELLGNYRRELRRQATARTRERQRTGEAPKIPGRGRGRGRLSGSRGSH